MEWNVRLEGGPADGDTAQTDFEPPELLYVVWCPAHMVWHWYAEPASGGERYRKAEVEMRSLQARYIFEDLFDTMPLRGELVTA